MTRKNNVTEMLQQYYRIINFLLQTQKGIDIEKEKIDTYYKLTNEEYFF